MIERVKLIAERKKVFIEVHAVLRIKNIGPNGFQVHGVEDEAAEEAVFGIGNEIKHLLRSSGKHSRQTWKFDIDVLAIGAPVLASGFVMERFTETVAVIAIITFEGSGNRIAFGLEDQSFAIVIVHFEKSRSNYYLLGTVSFHYIYP